MRAEVCSPRALRRRRRVERRATKRWYQRAGSWLASALSLVVVGCVPIEFAKEFCNPSLLAPGTTISATIANEFTEAVGDLYAASLILLGLILFVITFIVLAVARYMLARVARKAGA